jgi:hypothetical protein
MKKLSWFISIVAFGIFIILFNTILNKLGLFATIQLDEGILVSQYDVEYFEDTFTTGVGWSVIGLAVVFAYWIFKFVDQKTFKINYKKNEVEGSKDAIKFCLLYGIITAIMLKTLGDSTGGLEGYIRWPIELAAMVLGWYLFLRKYWNPFY